MTPGYLDLSWLGRERYPIVVKEAKEIERDAKKNGQWWRVFRRLKRLLRRG